MVFAGQDAWRKHPNISGLSKGLGPFPGLVLALSIFSVYVACETLAKQMTYVPPASGHKYKFTKEAVGENPEIAQ